MNADPPRLEKPFLMALPGYRLTMLRRTGLLVVLVASALIAHAASGKVLKVLPHFLDQQGRHALSPSLFERDAYQAHLRKHPAEVSALRFDVEWSARGSAAGLRLRLEARGGKAAAQPKLIEAAVKSDRFGSTWASVTLDKAAYEAMGGVVAWRVTLWDGDQQLAEQKSFLW
jgi:hypothetical protein